MLLQRNWLLPFPPSAGVIFYLECASGDVGAAIYQASLEVFLAQGIKSGVPALRLRRVAELAAQGDGYETLNNVMSGSLEFAC
jgi:hypothetical protein